MIKIDSKGNFKKTFDFLRNVISSDIFSDLDRYGRLGVDALSRNTPLDTGETARSWGYEVIKNEDNPGVVWYNTSETHRGTPIVILIQYGHGTGTGGYVPGFDFINPTMQPIFDQIVDDVWKKVNS